MKKIIFFLLIITSLNAENNETNATNFFAFGETFVKPECKDLYVKYIYLSEKSNDISEILLKDTWETLARQFGEEFSSCNTIAINAPAELKEEQIKSQRRKFLAPNLFEK